MFTTTKASMVGCVSICVLSALGTTGFSGGYTYIPTGPAETVSLERALFQRLPIYVCGIWPSKERMLGALKFADIQEQYVLRVEKYLGLVLKEDVRPPMNEGVEGCCGKEAWVLIPKLRWGSDELLARCPSRNKDIQGDMEFQASDRDVVIAVNSLKLFSLDVESLDDAQVVKAIGSILSVPEDVMNDLRVEKHSARLGDEKTAVCYGKIRCKYDELKPVEYDSTREWWSFLPFWITKGRLCVAVSTVDWKKGERPSSGTARMQSVPLEKQRSSRSREHGNGGGTSVERH